MARRILAYDPLWSTVLALAVVWSFIHPPPRELTQSNSQVELIELWVINGLLLLALVRVCYRVYYRRDEWGIATLFGTLFGAMLFIAVEVLYASYFCTNC